MILPQATGLAFVATALLASGANALWPLPLQLATGNTTLFIDQSISVTCNGINITYASGYEPPAGATPSTANLVQGGVARSFDAIFRKGLVPWKLRPKNGTYEPDVGGTKTYVKSLTIKIDQEDTSRTHRATDGSVSEMYRLNITQAGQAYITADTSIGVMRALETFAQLFYQHSAGNFWYTKNAPFTIQDQPKYPHRGLLIDLTRNWIPKTDVLRIIDSLSWNKLNRIHLHATDSQSWPLELPTMPEVSEKGAYCKTCVYSAADLTEIQEYAMHRGVEPIVEIEMPGHSGVVALSHPDAIVAYEQLPYDLYCAQPPCGSFKLNSTATFDFIEGVLDDVLPRVEPYSAYFHTGGDEYKANSSLLDSSLKTNDTKVLQPLLQAFTDRVHNYVRKMGLIPMVWEEMALDWNVTLGQDVIVQTWLGGDSIAKLTETGLKVIDSNYNYWYLDCGRGQWLNFVGAAAQNYYPFNDWCKPAKNWRLMYSHDPAEGINGTAAANILGGEAALWTETVDANTVDSLLWPRLGAVAEVLWSGNKDASGQNRTQFDVSPRLAEMRERMVARGVGAAAMTQLYCLQNDPSMCSLGP